MKKSFIKTLFIVFLSIFFVNNYALSQSSVIPSSEDIFNYYDVYNSYKEDEEKLVKIVDLINIIEKRFYEQGKTIKREDLYEGALNGIVNKLDDNYSEYLTIEDLNSQEEEMNGEYVGAGIYVEKKKGEPMEVTSPFIGSPAEKVGIKSGDRIIKVGGEDVLPLTAAETIKKIKGKENTNVELEILRGEETKPIKFLLTRKKIKINMLESEMIDDNIGYVSLLQFGYGVGDKIENSVKDLQSKGMKGLILDLRLNPGGSLNEAQDISSLFVKGDLITTLKNKNGLETKYKRTKNYLGDFPLVVLVNKGSASASELVAGAIKDYKRGTIIGTTTFGKGIVQSVIPLTTDNSAVKLTTAEYFTPKNIAIHKIGVKPDIEVEMEELMVIKGYANVSEKDLNKRKKEIEKILIKDKGEYEAKKIIEKGDVQLERALSEIKKKIK